MSKIKTTEAVMYEPVPPDASPVIHALRSLGYVPETAIADLIDNALDAKATNIFVDMVWNQDHSYIRVEDNGSGMDERTLVQGMKIGSKNPLAKRSDKELGRFGMGLKTASFSLGKRLTVLTKRAGRAHVRCWDLDVVAETNQWHLRTQAFPESLEWLGTIAGHSGTVVLVEKLDRAAPPPYGDKGRDKFFEQSSSVKKHLQVVFHRFLEGPDRVKLYLNQNPVQPWDPFGSLHWLTQEIPKEILDIGDSQVTIKGYVLPHHSNLTDEEYTRFGGPNDWYNQQGFYIYRNKRLLVAGGWLGLFSKAESTKLARIRVDFSQEADFDWQIDVKKSVARPPQNVKDHLLRWAENTRKKSHRAYYHRGVKVSSGKNKPEPSPSNLLWSRGVRYGMPHYVINLEHPLLVQIQRGSSEELQNLLTAYLKLLQELSPANAIAFTPSIPSSSEEIVITESDTEEIVALARICTEKMAFTQERAVRTIKDMPAFTRYAVQEIQRIIKEGL